MPPRFPIALPDALRARFKRAIESLPAGGREAGQRVLARVDALAARLERTAEVLDKVARVELSILEKLEPIVDDLGRLVRLELDEARRRVLGRAPSSAPHERGSDPTIIDVD